MRRHTRFLIGMIVAGLTLVGLPAAFAASAQCEGLAATIVGSADDDVLVGTAGNDVIAAKGGNDVVTGGGGHDVICGGGGDDHLIGNDGADRIYGGSGADIIEGKRGHDVLRGDGGADTLFGNRGRDRLHGDRGVDSATGGPGLDHCTAEAEATCDDTDPGYYVAPHVRTNGVTIEVRPIDDVAAAIQSAGPGETIHLLPGVHTVSGNIVLGTSGTRTEWIRITGAPDSARPVIDLGGAGEFRISASYVLLDHVEIRNGGGNNLHIAPETSDITDIVVRDTVIHDLAWGPGAAIKINRNNPQGVGVSRVYLEDNDVSEAIDNAVIDGVGVHKAVVRGNWIHDNDQGSHGIFFKGGSSKVLIEGNLVSGIRGNAALQLGGNTGAGFFDPAHAGWEGVDQIARNNLIADCDDSAVEIRGVKRGVVIHNTIVTQTGFAIFRLSTGWTNTAGASGNADLTISSNLVIGTGGDPQYARNDGGAVDVVFGPQLWAGDFHNSGSPTPDVPAFPQPGDVVVGAAGLATVAVAPVTANLSGIADAVARYTPNRDSPGVAVVAWRADALVDLVDAVRSSIASFGAIEQP